MIIAFTRLHVYVCYIMLCYVVLCYGVVVVVVLLGTEPSSPFYSYSYRFVDVEVKRREGVELGLVDEENQIWD